MKGKYVGAVKLGARSVDAGSDIGLWNGGGAQGVPRVDPEFPAVTKTREGC